MGTPDLLNDTYATSVTSNDVTTKRINVKQLELDGHTATGIALTPGGSSPEILTSEAAVHQAIIGVEQMIEQLDTASQIFEDNSVITLSKLSRTFEKDWAVQGFKISPLGSATFIGGTENAHLKVPSKFFTTMDHYFLVLDVVRLDSGYIEVTDDEGTVVKTIRGIGRHFIEYPITNDLKLNRMIFKVECKDVVVDDYVIINSGPMHIATQRVRDYIAFMLAKLSGGTAYATTEYVDNSIEAALERLNIDNEALARHLEKINPHNITSESIGAAEKEHTHENYITKQKVADAINNTIADLKKYVDDNVAESLVESKAYTDSAIRDLNLAVIELIATAKQEAIDAAAESATAMVENAKSELNASIENVKTSLTTHIDEEDPHPNLKPETIGAAEKEHTHKASEIEGISEIIGGSFGGSVNCIISAPQVGMPHYVDPSIVSKCVKTLLPSSLNHTHDSSYDYCEGYAFASKNVDSDSIQNFFKAKTDEVPEPISTFDVVQGSEYHLGYYMGYSRDVRSFKFTCTSVVKPGAVSVKSADGIEFEKFTCDWSDGKVENTFVFDQTDGIEDADAFLETDNIVFVLSDFNQDGACSSRVDLAYGAVPYDGVVVPKDVVVSYGRDGSSRVAKTVEKTIVPIPDHYKKNKQSAYVLGRVNEKDVISDMFITPVPPEFDNERNGIPLFVNKYVGENDHQTYGAITTTGIDAEKCEPWYAYVNDATKKLVSPLGNGPLEFAHTFVESTGVNGFSIEIESVDLAAGDIPDSVEVKGVEEGSDIERTLHINNVFRVYSPKSKRFVYSVNFTQPRTLKSIKFIFTRAIAGVIKIAKITPYMTSSYFNIAACKSKGLVNDEYLVVLGRVEYSSRGYFKCFPYADGKVVSVPINGYERCTATGLYYVPNPFFTNDIETSIDTVTDEDTDLTQPFISAIAEVEGVTREYVAVRTYTENVYRLSMVRNY